MNPRRGSAFGAAAALALSVAALTSVPAGTEQLRAAMSEPAPSKQSREAAAMQRIEQRRQREAEAMRREIARWSRGWRYPKPGHTVRQGQRIARKARNCARHKARTK